MIVKMKKAAVLVQSKDADSALGELRRLGVLHVEHQQPPKGMDILSLCDDIVLIQEALSVFSEKEFLVKPCREKQKAPADWRTAARHVVEARKRLDQLQEYSRNLNNRIIEWQPWGDFEPAAIQALAAKNVFVRLYQVPEKEVKNLSAGGIVKSISTHGDTTYCAVISREKINIPFKEVALPRMSLTDMGTRFFEDKKAMQDIQDDIRKRASYRESFVNIRNAIEKELEFHKAHRGMGQAGELTYLVGFIPVDAQALLLETAAQEKWGIFIKDPSADDNVPTFIRNPQWISWIQPLLKILEILPGYTEFDISPLFLVFFSLFFGMIIGDAGYGLMYLFLTYLAHRRLGAKMQDKRIFSLLYLLSSCAIAWGILTGTFFGQAWLLKHGVRALLPVLNDPKFIQGLCFLIGVTHLSLAHLWRFAVQIPALTALAELGWVGILWAAFLLVKMLLLGALFPAWAKYLIIGGISLVVLFSSPRKNIFARIGAGLGTIALSLMNSFGDIVSYVRLFAVGLAGVAISDAFNSMAAGAAVPGAIGIISAGFILMAGHALNFVLSPMSVLVHGVRLNVLEFSGHAGVTWSGTPYKPLSEK